MLTWWGTQNPDDVYFICTFDWSDVGWPMPFATEIDDYYWDFGNSFVPYFVVIGANNILMYSNNGYQQALNMVPDAIASFNQALPPTNLAVDEGIGLFTWDAPTSGNLTGYDIYLDSIFLENVTNTEFQFEDLVNGQTYLAGVSAVFDDGTSEIIEMNFTYTQIFDPPTNLEVYEATGLLTWDAPTSGNLTGYDIYLDSIFLENVTDTEFQFENLVNGQTYLAGVSAVFDDGTSEIIEIDFSFSGTGVGNGIISSINLIGNYPNPFNPTTTISFSVAQTSLFVNLDIYNMKGQKIKTLVNEKMDAGTHQVIWNGDDENNKPVSSGMYLYKLKSGVYTSTKKMILMK